MEKVSNNDILDLSQDWDKDLENNLPYSGRAVQKFIKETFSSKIGCLYYDTTTNRYLAFSSNNTRDEYLDNPQLTELILGTFDAPFNYNAEINLNSDPYVVLPLGTSGNYIEFTFDIKNKNGASVGEDVICTYTILRGSTKKVITQKYRAGSVVRFNVDQYLNEGTNRININIVGQDTLAATTVGVTYQIVNLVIADNMDLSRVYMLGEDINIEVPYSISGTGVKTMEWYLDGVLIPYVRDDDEITEIETSRIKYISLEGVSEGVHSLQYRASVTINDEKFYSDIFYRDIIVYNNQGTNNLVAVGITLPFSSNIIQQGEALQLQGVQQYVSYPIRIGLFNPTYASSTPLEIYVDSDKITTLEVQNDKEITYQLLITSYGDKMIKFITSNSEYNVQASVEKSTTSIEEITQSLSLALSAVGKTNSSSDKDVWTYGGYYTTFNNFKWLDTCGWKDNSLIISEGASISVNYAPLSSDSVNTGKTFEIEFASTNVSNNDAIICDLRNSSGTGILITASEASLISAGGAKVSTKYKAEENIRISFVINRSRGVANKTLIMMYINGILSGSASYATNDNFISDKNITIKSTEDANIILKSIRVYDIALSSNQILNNYILYRESFEEFLKIYDRNNIYEEGTSDLSTDKLQGQLPIMIITGNIPALEATTDKNLQIDVDVEYINLQNPKKSFTIKNGALRPQGTSSMSYPKKNFRLYTQKKDNTILYDADGKIVESRLYSFKDGAQPVNCWCFKADYAESSGTHNTGVARIWNDALKNFQINGEYKGRTKAQVSAAAANYQYDIRTCIDGFPILMFYRLDENSPLVFIGKYNFNNDKSTESVFGFRDIPNFDNSKVQCWEVLNNGHHLALFNDINNWDSEWADAFEGRYPDGNSNSADLKQFATWMSTVSQDNFATQKWDHLDVYKVAAYYIYLMRMGAVDQVVKNSMFTTEDGVHWFFINYDNDTVVGLRNDGLLIYSPYIDRQSLDSSFTGEVYAYAGHDSRLWNMLESDTEFMSIVREVDQALYIAGFSYNNIIDVLDNEQSGKWCERVYNHDAQYKYIEPFSNRGINNLFMLQGSRQSHRRWWLSERFALMDSLYVSGEYKANSFEVKLAGAPIGLEFSIKAGAGINYGYGVNNVPIEFGVYLEKDNSHTFTTTSVLNVGDPVRIYAAPYLKSIDISNFAPYLTQISIANVLSQRLGSKLEILKVGNNTVENTSLSELSGINQAIRLKELYIQNFKGLTSLDLSNNPYLTTLDATGSGLTSIVLPTGAPTSILKLPATLQAISINGLYNLQNTGLTFENNGSNLTFIEISNCPQLDTKSIVENFLTYKTAADNACSLTIDNINWEGVNADWLIRLGNFRKLNLKGIIKIDEVTIEQLTILQSIFGKNCFSYNSELYIKVPDGVYLVGPNTVRGLTVTKYELVATTEGTTSIELENNNNSLIELNNGYLRVGDINSDVTITIVGKFTNENGIATVVRKYVFCNSIKYPSSGTIEGRSVISNKGTFQYALNFTGTYDEDAKYTIEWSIEGDAATNNCVELGTTTKNNATIIVKQRAASEFTIKAVGRKALDNSVSIFNISKTVIMSNGNVILTKEEKPNLMAAFYRSGHAEHAEYMTDIEASNVLSLKDIFTSTMEDNFDEFVYFINVNPADCSYLKSIEVTLPFTQMPAGLFLGEAKIIKAPNLKRISVGTANSDGITYYSLSKDTIILAREQFIAPNLEYLSNEQGEELLEDAFIYSNNSLSIFDSPERIDCPKFRIKCKYRRSLTSDSMTDIITIAYASYLKYVNLNSLEFVRIDAINDLGEGDMELILGACKHIYLNGTFNRLHSLDLPNCEWISGTLKSSINTITAPKLKLYGLNAKDCPNLSSNFIDAILNCETINSGKVPPNAFPETIVFPNLLYINIGSGLFDSNVKQITYNKLVSTTYSNYLSINNIIGSSTTEVLTVNSSINMDKLFSNNSSVSPLRVVNLSDINIDSIGIKGYPNLEELNIRSLRTYESSSISVNVEDTTRIQKLHLNSYSALILNKCLIPNIEIILNTKVGTINISGDNSVTERFYIKYAAPLTITNTFFNNWRKLKTIVFDSNVAPSILGDSITGIDVPEGEEKIIYTQIGATGFDSTVWTQFCSQNGFTISYTLPATEETTE